MGFVYGARPYRAIGDGMKVLVIGSCEDATILARYLRDKKIDVERKADRFVLRDVFDADPTHVVVDEGAELRGTHGYAEAIARIKEEFPAVKVYGMSSLAHDDFELPLHEDGHMYKPLGNKDLEIFYRALINDESKDLVCIFLGLRFYASADRARLLKAKVADVLLHALSEENLVGIDMKSPPVDLTPTLSRMSQKKKSP